MELTTERRRVLSEVAARHVRGYTHQWSWRFQDDDGRTVTGAIKALKKLGLIDIHYPTRAAHPYLTDAGREALADQDYDRRKNADHVDGYDRDDLGESPDY